MSKALFIVEEVPISASRVCISVLKVVFDSWKVIWSLGDGENIQGTGNWET